MAFGALKSDLVLETGERPEAEQRASLVLRLREERILDGDLLTAFERVPRRLFVENIYQRDADLNIALPLPCGALSPEPTLIGRMIDALEVLPTHRVLEIGTGTGYQTAILSHLAERVVTIERFRTLIDAAESNFSTLKLSNITAILGDGMLGYPRHAPFHRIILTGSVGEIPQVLVEQLMEGGHLIAPMHGEEGKRLVKLTKTHRRIELNPLGKHRLPPLIEGTAHRL